MRSILVDCLRLARILFVQQGAKVALIVNPYDPYTALAQLGLTLPVPPAPGGNYCSAKTSGSIVFLAGVVSQTAEGIITGSVGLNRTVEDGYAAARSCALLQLAVLEQHLGTLARVHGILSVNGYVNSVAGFADSPQVINGASDLLVAVFGEAGRHVRAAIGVNGLPRNALVELQMTVEI
jgi:enamine deaminase RidA (YjgF/YER057c/UK114 family)